MTAEHTKCVEPCTYVIFGATGNLSRRKLMPALYHLEVANRLPEGTVILCLSRREWTLEQWVGEVRDMLAAEARGGLDEAVFERFAKRLEYLKFDLNEECCYGDMKALLDNDGRFPSNAAFYIA